MPNCGEGRLNGIGRSQVLRVCGRKVLEGQQFIAIVGQLPGGLRIFARIDVDEAHEGDERILACGGLPDSLQALFGAAVLRFGRSVEHVAGLVKLTPISA